MRIQRVFFPVFFILIVLSVNCNQQDITVGLCIDNYIQERWIKDKAFFIEEVNKLGGRVLVETANGDPVLQVKQARQLIDKGVDVLVVVPSDSKVAAEIVRQAHRNEIKVIAYDRLIQNCDLDYYITFDNIEVGKLQAGYITKVQPKGNYMILGGAVSDYNSIFLKLGHMSVLQPFQEKGDISIVYDVFVDRWHEDEGYRHTKKYLSKSTDLQAIIAANDALAIGAVRALKEFEMDKAVAISGQDADLQACQNIIQGKQTMTVYKPIRSIASTAAIAAMQLAQNKKIENAVFEINNKKRLVPSILLQTMLIVNKDNMDETIITDGHHQQKELFE